MKPSERIIELQNQDLLRGRADIQALANIIERHKPEFWIAAILAYLDERQKPSAIDINQAWTNLGEAQK